MGSASASRPLSTIGQVKFVVLLERTPLTAELKVGEGTSPELPPVGLPPVFEREDLANVSDAEVLAELRQELGAEGFTYKGSSVGGWLFEKP